jgi:serine/threonine protein kinase
MAKLQSGRQFGRWTLLGNQPIGKGGNAVVWRCENNDQVAAIKILKSYLLEDGADAQTQERNTKRRVRFVSEVQALQKNSDIPGVVELLDCHIPDEPTESNRPWFVMPLGLSLRDYVKSNEVTFTWVVHTFRALAGTLVELHSRGLSHRDIKPGNILIINHVPHFSDFGLVSYAGKEAVTTSIEFLGPLFYIAPEMMIDATSADWRAADIYSFAKTLWVVGSGQEYPIPGEQRVGVTQLRLSTYVTEPRAVLLDSLLDRCTRHNPAERPAACDIYQSLAHWCEPQGVSEEPLSEVSAIARQLDVTAGTIKQEKLHREWLSDQSKLLLPLVSSLLTPVAETLNNEFDFEDHAGNPLNTRIYEGENSMLWDQWAAPQQWIMPLAKSLHESSIDSVWNGSSGTLTQCNVRGHTVLLICGLRLVTLPDDRIVICAANVISSNHPYFENQFGKVHIAWKECCETVVGTPTTESSLRRLVSCLIQNVPSAVRSFVHTIKLAEEQRG